MLSGFTISRYKAFLGLIKGTFLTTKTGPFFSIRHWYSNQNRCQSTPTIRIVGPKLDTPLQPNTDILIFKVTSDISGNLALDVCARTATRLLVTEFSNDKEVYYISMDKCIWSFLCLPIVARHQREAWTDACHVASNPPQDRERKVRLNVYMCTCTLTYWYNEVTNTWIYMFAHKTGGLMTAMKSRNQEYHQYHQRYFSDLWWYSWRKTYLW